MHARTHHRILTTPKERGASLTELVIAVTIGGCMIAAAGQTLATMHMTQRATDAATEATENAAHALWLIVRDLRHAGFTATQAGGSLVAPSSMLCGSNTTPTDLLLPPITATMHYPDTCWRTAARRNHALILIYGEPNSGQAIDVADASRSVITVASDAILRWQLPPDETTRIAIGKAHLHAYYVDNVADNTATECGGSIPALYLETREHNGPEPREEIARGVERIVTRYGIDDDGDTAVDRYVNAAAVSDWSRIYAVKIWVVGRSVCSDPAFRDDRVYRIADEQHIPRDHYHRSVLTTTVALHGRNGDWDAN